MKAFVKAWQVVINPASGEAYDEAGLDALDAILYGPVKEVEELTGEVTDEMVAEFEQIHPDFRYDQLEIHTKV